MPQYKINPITFFTIKKYPTQKIEFDPDEGLKNRAKFEEKYGRRGERLIASLGGLPIKMDQVTKFVEPGRQFAKDSIRLVKRCTKPDRKEFQKIAVATAIGFCIMGFIGFFVKLIHIPINNIIVGS
ncbi:hypothetical protein L9F63_011994 [Diploptera punctata]|nr:hypothetical protein L9F63_011994 [Diploptera punctata]